MKSSPFCILVLTVATVFAQPVFTNLYSFNGGPDGFIPFSGVIADPAGSLYGVNQQAGPRGGGTVFQLTPPSLPGDPWNFAVLYSFTYGSTDGYIPTGPLVLRPDGSLVGSTWAGGTRGGGGTVFQLSPPTAGGPWTKTTLYSFDPNYDGTGPGPVSVHSPGIFGTLQYSGPGQSGFGSVYELIRDPSGTWHKHTLKLFTDDNGAYPTGVLAFDSAGNVYGASQGDWTGVYSGSVYQLVKPATGGDWADWTYNRLYTFGVAANDGLSPFGGVVFGLNGALYGTTLVGGKTGNGTVFSIAPPSGPSGSWSETVIYSFTGNADGWMPAGGLAAGRSGRLYGTSVYGGLTGCGTAPSSCGTVWVLKPPTTGGWTIGILHEFQGGTDSQQPLGPVLLGKGEFVYGTTQGGVNEGQNTYGTVYQIVP